MPLLAVRVVQCAVGALLMAILTVVNVNQRGQQYELQHPQHPQQQVARPLSLPPLVLPPSPASVLPIAHVASVPTVFQPPHQCMPPASSGEPSPHVGEQEQPRVAGPAQTSSLRGDIIAQSVEALLQSANSGGWETVKESCGITVSINPTLGASPPALRGQGELPDSPAVVLQALWDTSK
jgi:hypothetical protein